MSQYCGTGGWQRCSDGVYVNVDTTEKDQAMTALEAWARLCASDILQRVKNESENGAPISFQLVSKTHGVVAELVCIRGCAILSVAGFDAQALTGYDYDYAYDTFEEADCICQSAKEKRTAAYVKKMLGA